MQLELKHLLYVAPVLAAACLGLTYALNEKILKDVTLPTYIVVYSVVTIIVMGIVHATTSYKVNFEPLAKPAVLHWIMLSVLASVFAWCLTLFTIQNVSAVYAAVGEVSYPLFSVLFSFLIFGRHLDFSTLLGGGLILFGNYVIISSKLKGGG